MATQRTQDELLLRARNIRGEATEGQNVTRIGVRTGQFNTQDDLLRRAQSITSIPRPGTPPVVGGGTRFPLPGQGIETPVAAPGDPNAERFTTGQKVAQFGIRAGIEGGAFALGIGGAARLSERFLGETIGPALARGGAEITSSFMLELARQKAMGEERDLGRAALFAGTAGLGIINTAVTRTGGRVGKITPLSSEFVAQRTRTPIDLLFRRGRGARLTFFSPKPRTNLQLMSGVTDEILIVDQLHAVMPQLRKQVTPARLEKVRIMKAADAQKVSIDTTPIIEALENSKITEPILSGEFATFNANIDKAIERLTTKQVQASATVIRTTKHRGLTTVDAVAPDVTARITGLRPSVVDRIINEQLGTKAFTATGQPANSLVGVAFNEARVAAVAALRKALPREIAALDKAISEKLSLYDLAERTFGRGRPAEIGTREATIINLFQPGNAKTIKLLNFIDENTIVLGRSPGFTLEARRIATEREFSIDPRVGLEAGGGFSQVVGSVGRGVAKVTAPTQALTGPVVAGALQTFTAFSREELRHRAKPDPQVIGGNPRDLMQEAAERAKRKRQAEQFQLNKNQPTVVLDEAAMGAEEVGQ